MGKTNIPKGRKTERGKKEKESANESRLKLIIDIRWLQQSMDTGKYFLQLSFESVFQVFLLCPSAYPCLWINTNPFPRYDGDFFVRNLEASVEAKVKRGKPARRIRYLHYCTWAHREKRQHSAGGLIWITGFWHLLLFITSSPKTLFLRFSNFFFDKLNLNAFSD